MLNLLQNAAKFTDEGSITVYLEEQVNKMGVPMVVISVVDTGMGISLEHQEKLFEPFSQVDDSPTRKTGGSGLGLSISRSLVEMQGGDIWLESAEGVGSTFYFSLPIAGEYIPQTAPAMPEDDIHKDKKIIISVDDDAKVIDLYNRYLGPHGYKIVSVTDPSKALEQIKLLKPFAITLDIMMPKLDGWHVIEKLKSDPETKDIPIVICSILDNREKGYELGATDYLIKPILENELVETINTLNLKSEGAPPRILMVDDDRNAMRLVNKVLSDQGQYQLSFAEGGLVGLSEIQSNPPDALILDLFMPDLDGFSLLQTIRTDPALKDLPVIVLTGGDLSEEQMEELSVKKQAIIRKDTLDEKILLDCLHELLGG
jgi:CheY-like chemotaxis protein